jgi:nucleoside-triphosphatase
MKNIILSGPPRIGKTTIVRAVVSGLGEECAGFRTEEMLEQEERVGFKLLTIQNKSCILSHMDIKGHVHVGKYGVDLECVDDVGVAAIKNGIKAGKTIIIDEIGKMEILSRAFRLAVLDALDSKCPVLGTMLFKRNPFCDKIRARSDVEIIEVTEENRDTLAELILQKMRS